MKRYIWGLGVVVGVILAGPAWAQTAAKGSVLDQLAGQMFPVTVALLTPAVIQWVKAAWAKIPKWLIPVAAPALGILLDESLTRLLALQNPGWLIAAMAGSAGVGIREAWDQIKKVLAGTTPA